jgi:hypothetical protein
MNDKIKRLARKVVDLLPNPDSPQDLYEHFIDLMSQQKDYFNFLPSENKIKLLFYIWSLKISNNFEIGDSLLNRIAFANLIITQGDFYKKECEECSGNGETSCGRCGGDGTTDCSTCDGSGKVECEDCEGSGEGNDEDGKCDNCGGSGERDCNDCGGDGTVTCDYCNGGYEQCDKCDGAGDVETDDLEYNKYFICTWNKEIKDRCELTAGTPQKTMDEYDFDRLRDQYIILTHHNRHSNLIDEIKANKIYCTSYDDMPDLFSGDKMTISSNDPNQDIFNN